MMQTETLMIRNNKPSHQEQYFERKVIFAEGMGAIFMVGIFVGIRPVAEFKTWMGRAGSPRVELLMKS